MLDYKAALEAVLMDETGCTMCKHCIDPSAVLLNICDADECIAKDKFELDEERLIVAYDLHGLILPEMRDTTKEERDSIDNYIRSISKPTGVSFDDVTK